MLQLGIMSAHLSGDYGSWFRLGEESRERGYVNQALYCFRKAVVVGGGEGVDADWERAVLAKSVGQLKTVSCVSSISGWIRMCNCYQLGEDSFPKHPPKISTRYNSTNRTPTSLDRTLRPPTSLLTLLLRIHSSHISLPCGFLPLQRRRTNRRGRNSYTRRRI